MLCILFSDEVKERWFHDARTRKTAIIPGICTVDDKVTEQDNELMLDWRPL